MSVLNERYRISGRLCVPSIGEIFDSYDLVLFQRVLIWVLPYLRTTVIEALFETQLTIDLIKSPYTLPSLQRSIDQQTGKPFIVYQFLPVVNLAELIQEEKLLPLERAIKLFLKLINGLNDCHSNGIRHGRLNLHNILMANKEVKVFGFGIIQAQLVHNMSEIHKAYLSPEQLIGDNTLFASDLYTASAIFFRCLAGYELLTTFDIQEGSQYVDELVHKKIQMESNIPVPLKPIIERAMGFDSSTRYGSIQNLLNDLSTVGYGL